MATLKATRKPKISAASSPAELASAGDFDRIAQSLGLSSAEARPRRWLLRVGALLQKMRSHKHLKQEQMAQTAGVTQAYLSRLENGLIPKRGPTVEVLLRCAEAAGCDIEIGVRSRKDNTLIASVSSRDLEESSSSSPFHSFHASESTPVTIPSEVVEVIFESQHASVPSPGSTDNWLNRQLNASTKALEQAQESLKNVLEIYHARRRGRAALRGGGIVQLRSEELGDLSGQAATDLVQALEVLWPYGRKRGVTTLTGHGVQKSRTVKVGTGHLVVIGSNEPGAAIGSVRALETEDLASGTESET